MTDLSGSFEDRGPVVRATAIATLAVTTVFVATRLVSRAGIVRHLYWDDCFIVIAWFLGCALSTVVALATSVGLGKHDVNIDPQFRGTLRKYEYVFSILYNLALMATKTSILIFYLRLAKNTLYIIRLASWSVLVLTNVAGTILTFLNIFQCKPIQASFDTVSEEPQCIPLLTEFICSAPVNIITDIAILVLPIPVLTGMKLPTRQKAILVGIFTLGIFVTVVDVVRIYYLQQAVTNVPTGISIKPGEVYGDSPEFPWNASLSFMWSAVEVNIGIVSACIPTLKPLIIRILPTMLLDPSGKRSGTFQLGQNRYMRATNPQPLGSKGSQPDTSTYAVATEIQNISSSASNQAAPDRDSKKDAPEQQLATVQSQSTTHEPGVYFGFLNIRKPKSLIKTSPGESFRYCTLVTIVFLLWGFTYGLLNTLNNTIAAISDMTRAQTLALTSIYFGGGYFLGPLLVGGWILHHDERTGSKLSNQLGSPIGGFKATFIVGLVIYSIGTMTFWPSAVLKSFAGFMLSNFVVGFGLSVLETAANPFLALCGPPEYAEMRLLIAQGFQAVSSVVSGLLAEKVFFAKFQTQDSINETVALLDVQWTYLAVALFCVALALFFYYSPLPEVTDAELARRAARLPVDVRKRSIGGLQLRTICLVLAVIAQWAYVAAQESMSIFFAPLITSLLPSHDDPSAELPLPVSSYALISRALFATSRFTAGFITYLSAKYPHHPLVPRPRTVLVIFVSLSVVFAFLTVVLRPTSNPSVLAIPAVLYYFAEGPLWPLIFAIGLRGQGDRTKRAAACLTMSASSPAIWPFVMYAITSTGGRVQTAFIVVVVMLVVTLVYPLFLGALKDARAMVDPVANDGFRVRVAALGEVNRRSSMEYKEGSRDQSLDADELVGQRRVRGRHVLELHDIKKPQSSTFLVSLPQSDRSDHRCGTADGSSPTVPEEF